MTTLRLLLILTSVFSFNSFGVEPLPLEAFAKSSQFTNIKLSPDGRYFAATVPKEKTNVLVVVDRAKNKQVIAYGFGTNKYVGEFLWANNQRLVYTQLHKIPGRERKVNRGEIFAGNIDGTKRIQLLGYTASKSKLKSKRGQQAWAYLLHSLPNDKEHVLVRSTRWGAKTDDPDKIYKVNIYNQKRSLVTITPLGNISVVTDVNGQPVAAKGKTKQGDDKYYLYENENWRELPEDHPLTDFSFVSVSSDKTLLYMTKAIDGGTRGLFTYKFADEQIELLFHHPIVDINAFIRAPGSNTIIAVETMLDDMEYHYIEPKHPFAILHQQIAQAFAGQDISIWANQIEDKEMIVKVKSDTNPGDFYLFIPEKNEIKYLLSTKPWIYPEEMNKRQLVSFSARDGQQIHGYLTLPNQQNEDTPLIVDVHGGPFGVQESWHYDSYSQMWANNGFAVLQINFRGSGGFGQQFKEVAYQKRSSLIQHDIIDGTRWALQQPNISDDKVCITGGSFGGYSALMSVLLEPDLFKCSIPMYGPYDLLYQMKNADYINGSSVTVGAMEKYGDNEDHWKKSSPLTYIDRLKTPLLIVTGGLDKRVPPKSAHNLRAKLDEMNFEYEWLYKGKEGHGFLNKDNKIELYRKSLSFVRKHLELTD